MAARKGARRPVTQTSDRDTAEPAVQVDAGVATIGTHQPEKAEDHDVKAVSLTSPAGTKVTVPEHEADALKAQGFK